MYEVLVITVLVLVMLYAIGEVVFSERSTVLKLVWIALILMMPLFGVVVYFATAER
ncbi:MAG TPA: PLDc N-terminal domain-containing protein [Kofleriaceae bacterium]